jgi:hypothetical protein
MADKYQALIGGRETMVEGTVTSTGVAEAGDLVALDGSGKLSLTVFPDGIGPLVITAVASEDVGAGKFINIWNDGGTEKIRLADSTNDRPAHGFVKDAFLTGATVTAYLRTGVNDDISGMTPGARQYLGAAGARTQTVPSSPTDAISQFLGIAKSATIMVVDIEDEIVLA